MKRKLRTEIHGLRLEVGDLVGQGGEGAVYRARDLATGEILAVKIFADKFNTSDTVRRIRHLARLKLQDHSPVLYSPFDIINNGEVGHVSRWADGVMLEDLLKNPQFSFMQAIDMCLAIGHGVGVLHVIHMAHGDIQALNFQGRLQGNVVKVALFDFDNYWSPGLPPPHMVGQHLYMPPELRERPGAIPDIGTDLFELAVVFHEILLLRHPAAGYDDTEARFEKAMCSGVWMQDRSRNRRDGSPLGGYPVTVLNPDLENLFRRGVSRNVGDRPSTDEWKGALAKARNALAMCPHCGVQFVVDSSKVTCPLPTCGKPFPNLKLVFRGREFLLGPGTVVVGRAALDGAPRVSSCHVIFHKIGPDTWLTAKGSNPTFRLAGGHWIRLHNDKPVLVQAGDRLRLADVEVEIR